MFYSVNWSFGKLIFREFVSSRLNFSKLTWIKSYYYLHIGDVETVEFTIAVQVTQLVNNTAGSQRQAHLIMEPMLFACTYLCVLWLCPLPPIHEFMTRGPFLGPPNPTYLNEVNSVKFRWLSPSLEHVLQADLQIAIGIVCDEGNSRSSPGHLLFKNSFLFINPLRNWRWAASVVHLWLCQVTRSLTWEDTDLRRARMFFHLPHENLPPSCTDWPSLEALILSTIPPIICPSKQRPSVFSGLDFAIYSPSALNTLKEINSHCIFLWYVSGHCSVLELTLGDKSSLCFNRAIELYQQRIQWLTENSKKVIDFFFASFQSLHLYLLEPFLLQVIDLQFTLTKPKKGISRPTEMKSPNTAVS